MKSIGKLIFLTAACVILFPLARAQGQGALNKTTLGQSQNDERDVVNSLVPAPKRYGKGEKKDQVNAAELKSKSINDTTFGGSLLDTGIVGAAPKLDGSKEHAAPSEERPAHSATSEPASSASRQLVPTEKEGSFRNLSDTAILANDAEPSAAPAGKESTTSTTSSAAAPTTSTGDNQKKDQGGTTTSSVKQEKPAGTSTGQDSSSKPDGDH